MCSYKRAELLNETLKSIAVQNVADVEIIVCEDGDDGGLTRYVCAETGARYTQRKARPEQPYCNPAIPWNMAIKLARAPILILQNPECLHVGNVIEKLTAPHQVDPKLAVFAAVESLSRGGRFFQWYCHPEHSPRPLFFCGSVRREHVWKIRGFEEDFARGTGGYGFDDDYFAHCLSRVGVKFMFLDDAVVKHQWHDAVHCCFGLQSNQELFLQKMQQLESGAIGVECNDGRDWGVGAG